jgi:hypothetical protein
MGVGGQLHTPAALPPGKRPGTHCIGGCVCPRAGLDGCGKSRPHRDPIPGPSSPQQVTIPTTLSQPIMYKSSSRKLHIRIYCRSVEIPSDNLKYSIIGHLSNSMRVRLAEFCCTCISACINIKQLQFNTVLNLTFDCCFAISIHDLVKQLVLYMLLKEGVLCFF